MKIRLWVWHGRRGSIITNEKGERRPRKGAALFGCCKQSSEISLSSNYIVIVRTIFVSKTTIGTRN